MDLHGNLSQPQRDRNLATFAAGNARVLVATDVAARGIDIDHVELVVHVDPPAEHKAYLHRSGRTARAGESGDVVTVVLPAQRADVAALLRKAAIAVAPQRVTSTSPAVAELIGEVAAYVTPAPRAVKPVRGQSQGGRSQGANAQRKRANREPAVGRGGVAGGHASGAPRRDRSGRPAASGAPQGQRASQSRSSQPRAGQPRSGLARTGRGSGGAAQRSFTSYSTSTPTGGARREGRRAQG